MALRGGVEGLIFLRWGWWVSYKAYCSTTTDNLYAFEDVSVYIMMYMYVVGGIRRTLDMGLEVSTACLWQFAVGCCLQRVSLTICGYVKDNVNIQFVDNHDGTPGINSGHYTGFANKGLEPYGVEQRVRIETLRCEFQWEEGLLLNQRLF